MIAEVLEESEPPVNNRMAALGGVVFRWSTDQSSIPTESPNVAAEELKLRLTGRYANVGFICSRSKPLRLAGNSKNGRSPK